MGMTQSELVLWFYGVGFTVSLLHLRNVGAYNLADAVLRSFLWPFVLLYFIFQFIGYVSFSAFYGFLDWARYPLTPSQAQDETIRMIANEKRE